MKMKRKKKMKNTQKHFHLYFNLGVRYMYPVRLRLMILYICAFKFVIYDICVRMHCTLSHIQLDIHSPIALHTLTRSQTFSRQFFFVALFFAEFSLLQVERFTRRRQTVAYLMFYLPKEFTEKLIPSCWCSFIFCHFLVFINKVDMENVVFFIFTFSLSQQT